MEFQFEAYSLVFVIIILMYMFLGFRKGFGYALLYMVAPIFTFVAALVIAQPVARLVMNVTPFGEMIYGPIFNTLIGMSTYFKEANPGRELLTTVLVSGNFEAVVNMGVPSFAAPIVTALILASVPEAASDVVIGEYVAQGATFAIIYLFSIILVNVILGVILAIIRSVNAKKKKRARKEGFAKKPTIVSRLIGMVFGAGVGFFSVCIIGYALDILFTNDPTLNYFLNALWQVNDPTTMTIGKWLILNNPLKTGLLHLFQYFNF